MTPRPAGAKRTRGHADVFTLVIPAILMRFVA